MNRLQFVRDLLRLVLTMVASTVAAASLLAQGSPATTPNLPTILTTGEAIVRRAPDVAYLTLAVEARAKSPRDAQRQNADALAGVQRQLANTGVAREGQRTLGLGLGTGVRQRQRTARGARLRRPQHARDPNRRSRACGRNRRRTRSRRCNVVEWHQVRFERSGGG